MRPEPKARMGHLSEARLKMVMGLIEQAPDAAVRHLQRALSADHGHDVGLSSVQRLVEAEAADRRTRNLVLAPIAPLCAAPGPFTGLHFPPRTLSLIWKTLKAEAADDVAEAAALAEDWKPDSPTSVFDLLCARTVAGLREREEAFAAAAAAADAGGGCETLAACLEIAEVTRRALDQMPEWLGRMTGEKAAKLRLAYRDAVGIADDAGPRFFEMLAAHLAEPWLIMRVISGVMDRPNEAYFAGSELASFGERVFADIDRQLAQVAAFKPQAGRDGAISAARAVSVAITQITEIEQSIALAPEGAWGKRLAHQRKTLATSIEVHLRAVDASLNQALPLQILRLGPRSSRGVPKLTNDPDAGAIERAATLLVFVNEVRPSAAAGGFASARAKVLEAMEARLDSYVEDILEEIRGGECADLERAKTFLEIAADFCGLSRDEKAAQIVRRRAAAA